MQDQAHSLVEEAAARFESIPSNQRLLISVAGIPGSGKTTLAAHVVRGLNEKLGGAVAAMVPMDGYHYTRAQLSAMPDPARAHYCRGAHWTFDPIGLAKLIVACKAPISETEPPTIYAASFDHAVKDPVENDIPIKPTQRILVFEGNYLSLSAPEEWTAVSALFDMRWFVEVDENLAKQRLAKRHVAAGISATLEDGVARAEGNDIPNGRFLLENRVPVDIVIESKNDLSFAAIV